jgi:hypothetical protein
MADTGRTIKLRCGTRRLDPRVSCSPLRCAENLCSYVERLARRAGMQTGTIAVTLHGTAAPRVDFGTTTTVRRGGRRPGAAAPRGAQPAPTARKPYTIAEARTLLERRMARLLKHFDFQYGRLYIELVNGQVVRITPAPGLRPTAEELPLLARFFSRAPPAALWHFAKGVFGRRRSA